MAETKAIVKNETNETERPEPTWGGTHYTPQVDVYEDDNELVFACDMAGVRPEGLALHYENGELTFHGRVYPRQQNARYRLCEYGVGDFYRTFAVNVEVDPNRISAEYKLGVLTIRLPKKDEVKPRRIQIQAQ
jgi:HSP20 family protein